MKRPLGHFSIGLIQQTICAAGGNKQQAAAALGLSDHNLRKKLWQHYGRFPDARWDDSPLAWAVRHDADRVAVAPLWTRADIEIEAEAWDLIALVSDERDARNMVRTMNTTIAVRAAKTA